MSWLSEKEIVRLIRRHADPITLEGFQGVFPMDELPFAVGKYPFFMIVNTQAHNLPGEHWIAVFIGKDKRGEIFDSFAMPPSNTLIRWMNQFTRTFTSSRTAYQHPLSATCGAYVLYYILHRLRDPQCMTHYFSASIPNNEKRVLSFYHSLK